MSQKRVAPWLVVLSGLLMTIPLWNHLHFHGHSALYDYVKLLSLDNLIRSGVLYSRWMPDTYFGYGSPVFHFYAPLSYYLSELFVLLGFLPHTAIKLTYGVTLIGSGLGMYAFCRDFARPFTSMVAGVFYMCAPYRATDMFVRHALGEHMSFLFLPLVCWGLSGMVKEDKRWLRFLIGFLSLAALILTHNIAAMLAMGVFVLWFLLLLQRTRMWRSAWYGASILFLGLASSLFFWLPALVDKSWIRSQDLLGGTFAYSRHFLTFSKFLSENWTGYAHGYLLLFTPLAFVLLWKETKRLNPVLLLGTIVFGCGLLFALPIAKPLYDNIPLLPFVQFPWRFFILVTFATSMLVVGVDSIAFFEHRYSRFPWAALSLLLLMAVHYTGYSKALYASYSLEHKRIRHLNQETTTRLLKRSDYLHLWELGGLSHWKNKGAKGTSRDDFLPQSVKRKPRMVPKVRMSWLSPGKATIRMDIVNPIHLSARVTTPHKGQLLIHHFYFPGWQASINGRPVVVQSHPTSGAIVVDVPKGSFDVVVRFVSTPFWKLCELISYMMLLFGLGITLFLAQGSGSQERMNS